MEQEPWYIDNDIDEVEYSFSDYEITSTPNDFNVKTIIDFIDSGLFKIPGFQRNYVWDIKRASKLVESVIMGLPIPQVFLYEESKNSYLVIDGQQRLWSIYFFSKKRFPRKNKRAEIRQIFKDNGGFDESILYNDDLFEDFRLKLKDNSQPQTNNKLEGLSYPTLNEYKTNFDLRPLRNIMVKQNFPTDDDSAMFEIFNRLNTGGMSLKPQEIRTSLYHSLFYEMLYDVNTNRDWRILVNKMEPDVHMKDVEILLRGFALLIDHNIYKPTMSRFLNGFSKRAKSFNEESLLFFKDLFIRFCEVSINVDDKIFLKSGKFNITLFEAIFVAICKKSLIHKDVDEIIQIDSDKIQQLKEDVEFSNASQDNVAGKTNVDKRINRAQIILAENAN